MSTNKSQAIKVPFIQAEPEVMYTVYKSNLKNHSIIMQSGKVLHVINGEYITNDLEEIAFLDHEISSGFPYMSKGERVTLSSRDPMKALRAKIIAEYEAAKLAESPKLDPVIGDSDTGQSVATKLSPASSAVLAKLSAGSGT